MPMSKKHLAVSGSAALLVVVSLAFAGGKGILFPDFSEPTKGTFEKPEAEIGKKPTAKTLWSTTTVAGGIVGKGPLKGEAVSITGEVIDLSCYLQVGKHGDKHRDCGQKCARHGQPIGLLTADGSVYMLIDEEHDPRRDGQTELRTQLIDHMAHVVKVNGTYSEVEGQKAIYVQGSIKSKS
ncbi:MAG: hypothetical protein ABI353_07950 [Isosphaeraceae bacterium]